MSNNTLDLVMMVIEENGEGYRAPQAASPVDDVADLDLIAYKHPRCCICKAPAAKKPNGSGDSSLQVCHNVKCAKAKAARLRAEYAAPGNCIPPERRRTRGHGAR